MVKQITLGSGRCSEVTGLQQFSSPTFCFQYWTTASRDPSSPFFLTSLRRCIFADKLWFWELGPGRVPDPGPGTVPGRGPDPGAGPGPGPRLGTQRYFENIVDC